MATSRSSSSLLISLLFSLLFSFFFLHFTSIVSVQGQPSAAPAPSPTSDGSSIDLGIAYTLMFVALAVTYLMHPIDAFPFNLF